MNDFQNIKRLLLPILKGLPFIAAAFIIALTLAHRSLMYTNPMYESTVKIKLDDISNGISSSTLYEDFDVFANTNKIAAEVEVLKSQVLIEKAIRQLDFDLSYYRVGKARTAELYHDNPFTVDYTVLSPAVYDKTFDLWVTTRDSITLSYTIEGKHRVIKTLFDKPIYGPYFKLTIHRNDSLLHLRQNLQLVDHYQFKINSIQSLIGKHTSNLDITAIDKDVAVLRISYKDEIAEKTSQFVNTLAKVYIDDYIDSRTGAAGKTVSFINNQLELVAKELAASEAAIENYRLDNNIINIRQETETDLRKISQLKIQLANLEMNEAALDTLEKYIIKNDDRFLKIAPNFEAFTDLLSTELIKKIKFYQAEKKDLLLKYTPENEKVKVIDEKLKDITDYLKESIKNTRKNIGIKRLQVKNSVEEAEKVFIGLPTKEKKIIILERDFQLNQKIYNFLTEKKTEAAIAEAATISFHRIIKKAYPPKKPVSPNRTLTYIVSGFLGLLVGIAFIFIRQFIGGKISTKDQLEKKSGLPISSIIKKYTRRRTNLANDFQSIVSNLIMLDSIQKGKSILITSSVSKEGKTFTTKHMAEAFAELGWKVALLDVNFRSPQIHEAFQIENGNGVSNLLLDQTIDYKSIIQNISLENLTILTAGTETTQPIKLISNPNLEILINKLKADFDVVIIDSPATAIALDAVKLMQIVDHVYYIVRANYTKSHFLLNADLIADEYDFKHIKLLFNGVHKATNYSGKYTGSRYNYGWKNKNWKEKIIHYIRHYF